MSGKMAIIDFGMGNLNSVRKALGCINQHAFIASTPYEVEKADKIILPGIGHFKKAMENLKQLGFVQALHESVLIKKKPVLGICLGMQLMATSSMEGNVPGLGWMEAEVVTFNITGNETLRVPHMGWNRVKQLKQSPLMQSVSSTDEFYFVHSYHWKTNAVQDILGETGYGYSFPSIIEKENILGVQFHPEKSHSAGLRVLKNFSSL